MDTIQCEVQAVCDVLADDEWGPHFLPINVQTGDGQEGLGLLFCLPRLGTHLIVNRILLGRKARVTVLRPDRAERAAWIVRVLSTVRRMDGSYEHVAMFVEQAPWEPGPAPQSLQSCGEPDQNASTA